MHPSQNLCLQGNSVTPSGLLKQITQIDASSCSVGVFSLLIPTLCISYLMNDQKNHNHLNPKEIFSKQET
jgi:hypothetical protein